MKNLELKQMEIVIGGDLANCIETGAGASIGIGLLIIGLGIASGGIGFAVAGLLSAWGGSAATIGICSSQI